MCDREAISPGERSWGKGKSQAVARLTQLATALAVPWQVCLPHAACAGAGFWVRLLLANFVTYLVRQVAGCGQGPCVHHMAKKELMLDPSVLYARQTCFDSKVLFRLGPSVVFTGFLSRLSRRPGLNIKDGNVATVTGTAASKILACQPCNRAKLSTQNIVCDRSRQTSNLACC